MGLISITKTKSKDTETVPLFRLGFRPFFLGAGIFAVISMVIWLHIYVYHPSTFVMSIPVITWHAHEMIYGFGMAVIAGFLLTAVGNWTGEKMPSGYELVFVFVCWVIARIAFFVNTKFLLIAAIFDLTFMVVLAIFITKPILKVRQYRQLAVVTKVLLLFFGNLVFYLGVLGVLKNGVYWGIYTGFYVTIGLILTVGRRVIPFFIERGVGGGIELKNSRFIDLSSLVLFLVFFILEVFLQASSITKWLAIVLFALHLIRIYNWHTPGIWTKPLLWSLYLSYNFIILGFLLFFISKEFLLSMFLPIHSFAVGGIGLITLSMMARVSLGHTGRDIHKPHYLINWAFCLLIFSAVSRIASFFVGVGYYKSFIASAQIGWILAFSIFVFVYTPILCSPRIDGKAG